jgi:hypothetical protein
MLDLRKYGISSHNAATASCYVIAILMLRKCKEKGEQWNVMKNRWK